MNRKSKSAQQASSSREAGVWNDWHPLAYLRDEDFNAAKKHHQRRRNAKSKKTHQ
jgi:hypothetical protein